MVAPSSSRGSYDYDYVVFLNFRGKDTRNGFTAHLYEALRSNGIETFMDANEVSKGQKISSALVTAIENSMFCLLVFSQNYASSPWCLEELVHILRCKRTMEQTVFPIFYNVDPSDVRDQQGSFGKALAEHELNKGKVRIWREALAEAAGLSGWDSRNRHEPTLINDIVKHISNKMVRRSSKHTELAIRAEDVLTIGIWGTGGMGKKNLARVVYDHFSSQFEGCCFLENVREESQKHGLPYLCRKLLSHLLGTPGSSTGFSSLETRLCSKRVLIVLDDVDNLKQLELLAGKKRYQFGPGSRIIITTRGKQLLIAYGVNEIREAEELSVQSAISLFQQHHHTKDVMKLSSHVIDYIKGFQLLYKVIGFLLFMVKMKREVLMDKSQSEEEEQLSRSIQEDFPHSYPPLGNGSIYQAILFPVSTGFKICAGCSTEIIQRCYLKCIGKVWHPECFRCHSCAEPITDYEFYLFRESPYHKSCYKEQCRQKCDVCGYFFWANPANPMEHRAHPFWVQKYCPSHDHDGTPQCFSCERKEPWGTTYLTLKDGRKLCLECLDHAIMDAHECQPLYLDVEKFCESLNVVVGQKVRLRLVGRRSPSESTGGEKRSLVDMIREPYKLVPGSKTTTFNILYGLPRLLTGAILAHLMMRVWLLRHHPSLTPHVAGGICQVLAYMWLGRQLMSGYGSTVAPTSSPLTLSSTKGARSKFERKLGEFLKYLIESDDSVYGDGFRDGYKSVLRYGLQKTIDHILMTGSFPPIPVYGNQP